ncbi:hypothetical protein NDU88_006794, partial [Pleurodeles waltl]
FEAAVGASAGRVLTGVPCGGSTALGVLDPKSLLVGQQDRKIALLSGDPRCLGLSGAPYQGSDGNSTEGPAVNSHTFASYYQNLNGRVPQPTAEQENPILGDLLPSSLAAKLDLPLSKEEVGEAIFAIQSGKTSGPDVYRTEYYKQF